jgi:hypothetical protein
METKSRYEVIAELEDKKRVLIKERDGLDDEVKDKELNIKNLERRKADLPKLQQDFELKIKHQLADLDRQKVDFEIKQKNQKDDMVRQQEAYNIQVANTIDDYNRQIEDAKVELENFKATILDRKNTIKELIVSVETSLQRFTTQQTK